MHDKNELLESESESESKSNETRTPDREIRIPWWHSLIAYIIGVIAVILFCYSGLFVIALMNMKPDPWGCRGFIGLIASIMLSFGLFLFSMAKKIVER